ncbi:MAG: STAS/SEC14 domain-containing protein [Ignavibacterium sp.]|nr:STAS/SEC14 domain-containing protein [Ignavibacterium sp.]
MKYTVSVSNDRKYIIVFIDGPMTTELALKAGKQANRLAGENKLSSMLYDLRKSRNVQNGFKNYEFGYKDVGLVGFDKSMKIALLTDQDDHSHDLIETVMVNNGYNVRIFSNQKEAIDWLIV